jgi:hypothetical protein
LHDGLLANKDKPPTSQFRGNFVAQPVSSDARFGAAGVLKLRATPARRLQIFRT